jgi:CspA family cold shock protein
VVYRESRAGSEGPDRDHRSGGSTDGEAALMAQGTVKWFNEAKGFGFITNADDGKDVFVHYSAIRGDGFRTLAEGQPVRFELMQGPKGLYAADVEPAE